MSGVGVGHHPRAGEHWGDSCRACRASRSTLCPCTVPCGLARGRRRHWPWRPSRLQLHSSTPTSAATSRRSWAWRGPRISAGFALPLPGPRGALCLAAHFLIKISDVFSLFVPLLFRAAPGQPPCSQEGTLPALGCMCWSLLEASPGVGMGGMDLLVVPSELQQLREVLAGFLPICHRSPMAEGKVAAELLWEGTAAVCTVRS